MAALCALVRYLAKLAFLFWACRTSGLDKIRIAAEVLRIIHTSPPEFSAGQEAAAARS
jgi:hypothetical protein